MVQTFSRGWVDEPVVVGSTPARERSCQNGQAFETEARLADAAAHLVTLRLLRQLIFEVLLRDHHVTCGALFGPRFLHPLTQTTEAHCLPTQTPLLLCMLFARFPPMEGLSSALQARTFLAHRAPQLSSLTLLKRHPHGTIWCWASPQIRGSIDGLLQAERVQSVEGLVWHARRSQGVLCQRHAALWTGHLNHTIGEPSFHVAGHAYGTVPPVLTR